MPTDKVKATIRPILACAGNKSAEEFAATGRNMDSEYLTFDDSLLKLLGCFE